MSNHPEEFIEYCKKHALVPSQFTNVTALPDGTGWAVVIPKYMPTAFGHTNLYEWALANPIKNVPKKKCSKAPLTRNKISC